MGAAASLPAAVGALATQTWTFLTNPYTLSALAAGALALFLANLLAAAPTPLDAKPRQTAGDVRRIGNTAFVFRASASSLPDLLLDVAQRRLFALHPRRPASLSEPPQQPAAPNDTLPRLSISLPLRTAAPFCRDDFREQLIAGVDQIRVLERGLHFHEGRAVAVTTAPEKQETLLQFRSRSAAQAFLDVLNRVKAPSEKRPEKVSLFLTTFNVGNSQPPDDLSPWLGPSAEMDIVAIGAQECSYTVSSASGAAGQDRLTRNRTDSSRASEASEGVTEATPLLEGSEQDNDSLTRLPSPARPQNSRSASGKDHWHSILESHFSSDEYECIARLSAWDRCLTIFVKRKLLPDVSRIRHDTANVGLGGVAGNKGAIGVRFSVFDTDFLIINSHLAAHHKEVNRRNEDFASIAGSLYGLRDNPEVDVFSSAVHHTFWMGDLNYRINLDRDKVLKLIEEKEWKQLQEADQLLLEMAAGRSFQGFREGKTDFAPTYRYEYGSRKYSAVKMRVPSYCDRILYRSLLGCSIDLLDYRPCDDIMTSDHSPVAALFSASLLHTTGSRNLEMIATGAGIQEGRGSGLMSPLVSPRSLSMRALLPSGIPGFSTGKGAQLVFKSLSAVDIPEIDHGGRRIAVAKALYLHNHVGWKKHDELGEGQHADPYCTFHGDAVAELDEGIYRTRTVTASQNPVWEEESLPPIDLISSELSVLKGRYVVITVKDEIPTRRDDTIGSAVIQLGSTADSSMGTSDSPVAFELPVMQRGRQQGKIRGLYMVRRI